MRWSAKSQTMRSSSRSGGEALELVMLADPDVLLCDYPLPDSDGMELTRQLAGTPESSSTGGS